MCEPACEGGVPYDATLLMLRYAKTILKGDRWRVTCFAVGRQQLHQLVHRLIRSGFGIRFTNLVLLW